MRAVVTLLRTDLVLFSLRLFIDSNISSDCPRVSAVADDAHLSLPMLASGPHVIRGLLGLPESGTQMVT